MTEIPSTAIDPDAINRVAQEVRVLGTRQIAAARLAEHLLLASGLPAQLQAAEEAVALYAASRDQREVERDAALERARVAEDALRYLADRDNWSADPHDIAATLYGHFTPYELAVQALGGSQELERFAARWEQKHDKLAGQLQEARDLLVRSLDFMALDSLARSYPSLAGLRTDTERLLKET